MCNSIKKKDGPENNKIDKEECEINKESSFVLSYGELIIYNAYFPDSLTALINAENVFLNNPDNNNIPGLIRVDVKEIFLESLSSKETYILKCDSVLDSQDNCFCKLVEEAMLYYYNNADVMVDGLTLTALYENAFSKEEIKVKNTFSKLFFYPVIKNNDYKE